MSRQLVGEVIAASTTCCDEYSWVLDSRGRPVEPAVKCSDHPEKPGATLKPADPAAPADAPDTRDGNKNKFAWIYDVYADPAVSLKAKVVGPACALKLAGRKGFFKATRKAIANLCGTSQTTVRRALDDLVDQKYLTVEFGEGAGAANTYHLILPAQRCEEWLVAEKEYQRKIADAEWATRSWLFAENKWRNEQTESLFREAVFDASIARGANEERAHRIADHVVAQYRAKGLELDVEQGLATVARSKDDVFTPAVPAPETVPSGDPEPDQKRAAPGSMVSRPRLNGEPTPAQRRADPGSMVSRPRLTPEANTSGYDQTHKSFKDSESPVKDFQDSESEPARREALTRSLRPVRPGVGECEFCGPDGLFRDPDGFPVVLAEHDDDGENWIEHPVECQHSMAANLAEIQRREKAESLELCKTGWPEIDAHYPLFDDDDPDVF